MPARRYALTFNIESTAQKGMITYMKKTALIAACIILAGAAPAPANAAGNISVFLNGSPLSFDCQPMIKNDRTFVPVRKIFESFGMDVDWDEENKCVYSHDDENEISMGVDCDEMWVNGSCIKLDTAPFIQNGRTLVPLRAISEALKCAVDWNGKTCSVIIGRRPSCGKATAKPTAEPTVEPTEKPIVEPTAEPTVEPTEKPTVNPTAKPTAAPTVKPTAKPTVKPTAKPTAKPTVKPSVSTASEMEKEVLEIVNQERTSRGLKPLTWAEDLANVARAHSRDMINRNFFSHTNPDGQSPFDRIKANGISYRAAAENIAYGQKNAQAVMNSWMNSSGHRANILNANLKEIGIGAVKNQNGTIYWTQVFVTR